MHVDITSILMYPGRLSFEFNIYTFLAHRVLSRVVVVTIIGTNHFGYDL